MSMLRDHSQDIMLKLNNDRKTSAKYCDITLIVDEHKYPAHKCVLGLLSPFYDKMFSIEMKERFDNEAVIKGVSKEVFEAILEFVYTSSITLNMENVFGMIEAAHYMDLPLVKESCFLFLSQGVTAENWTSIVAFAKRYDYHSLLQNVDMRLSQHLLGSILNSKRFCNLEEEELKHLLGLQNRKLVGEERVYQAVLKWINHDGSNREKYAQGLFRFVSFSQMTSDFLRKVVANEKLLENCTESVKAAFRAIGHSEVPESQSSSRTWKKVNSRCTTIQQGISLGSRNLSLQDFVAVDSITVWKLTSRVLHKQALKYRHTEGSAVLWTHNNEKWIKIVGGFETKEMEGVRLNNLQHDSSSKATKFFRYPAAAVVNDQRMYVAGGLSFETSSEVFALMLDKTRSVYQHVWKLHDNMNVNRHSNALVSFCGAIYVIGGNPDIATLCFDEYSKKTKMLSPMLSPRSHLATVVHNREIYAIGGIYNGAVSCLVEVLNPMMNMWRSASSLNVARYRPGTCVLGNQIVVVGGGSSKVEVYNEKENRWKIIGECQELKDVFAIFPC